MSQFIPQITLPFLLCTSLTILISRMLGLHTVVKYNEDGQLIKYLPFVTIRNVETTPHIRLMLPQ